MPHTSFAIPVPSLFVLFVLFVLLAPAGPVRAETFEIDGGHSSVVFKIKNAGVSHFYGRFNAFTGTLTFDEADPTASSVSLEVKTDTVDTANADRDKHVRGKAALNTAQFPLATFKSRQVKKVGADRYAVTGALTFLGVSRDVEVAAVRTGYAKDGKETKAGFEGTFKFKRSDFGWKGMGNVSDEVEVIVGLMCNAKPAATAEK